MKNARLILSLIALSITHCACNAHNPPITTESVRQRLGNSPEDAFVEKVASISLQLQNFLDSLEAYDGQTEALDLITEAFIRLSEALDHAAYAGLAHLCCKQDILLNLNHRFSAYFESLQPDSSTTKAGIACLDSLNILFDYIVTAELAQL